MCLEYQKYTEKMAIDDLNGNWQQRRLSVAAGQPRSLQTLLRLFGSIPRRSSFLRGRPITRRSPLNNSETALKPALKPWLADGSVLRRDDWPAWGVFVHVPPARAKDYIKHSIRDAHPVPLQSEKKLHYQCLSSTLSKYINQQNEEKNVHHLNLIFFTA